MCSLLKSVSLRASNCYPVHFLFFGSRQRGFDDVAVAVVVGAVVDFNSPESTCLGSRDLLSGTKAGVG